jgi:thioredoxin-like negative regulator of GroEL
LSVAERAPASKPARDERPTLILFFSPTSDHSRRVDGFLAQVLQRRKNHETFRIVRVDADEHPELVDRFRVTAIPSLLVVDGKRVRGRLAGPRGCIEIGELLEPWLGGGY